LGHTPREIPAVKAACTTAGKTAGSECTVCGEVLTPQEEIPATGHTWSKSEVTAPATCTEEGVLTWYCYNDPTAVHSKTEAIPATGHTPREIPAVKAACTTAGKTAGSECAVCGEVLTPQEEIPATGHTWSKSEVTAPATCTEDGVLTWFCYNDPTAVHSKTEAIPALGHTPREIPAVKAACTTAGKTAGSECAVCGMVLTPQEEIPALGHLWDEGTVVREPDVGVPGLREYTCQRDPMHTMTESIPALTEPVPSGTERKLTPQDLINGLRRPVLPITRPILGPIDRPIFRLALQITEHPQSCSIPYGGSAMLTVKADGGTPAYTYEWHRGIISQWKPIIAQSPADGTSSRPITIGGQLTEIVEKPVWKTIGAIRNLYTAEEGSKLVATSLPVAELRWRIPPTLLNLSDQIVKTGSDPTLTVTEGGYQYWCVVTDSKGDSVTSNKALVSYYLTPVLTIDREPEDWNMQGNDMWRFDVTVSGGERPYTYQWYAKQPGGNAYAPLNVDQSYIFNSDSAYPELPANDPSFWFTVRCEITDNASGSVTSREAEAYNLTVAFTSGTYEYEIAPGGSMELAVEADGSFPPFTYQWYVYRPTGTAVDGSQAIAGETGNSITVSKPDWYMCIVTDAHGHTEYDYCVVDYDGSLWISRDPQDYNVYDYDWWEFEVEAQDGVPPYTYQWFLAEGGSEDYMLIDGADASYISSDAFPVGTPFNVYCTVTDNKGRDVDSMAAEAYNLVVIPASEVSSMELDTEETLAVEVHADYLPVTCKWYFQPLNSDKRFVMANEGEQIPITEPGFYECEVTDAHGHQEIVGIFVDVAPLSLEILSDVTSILPGESYDLVVTAHGGYPPYVYTWYHDGVEVLITEEKPSGELSYLPISEPGVYLCDVRDAEGFFEGVDFIVDLGFAITEEPQDCNMQSEGMWYFSAAAEGGMPPYQYEWMAADAGSSDFAPIGNEPENPEISDIMFPDRAGKMESRAFSVFCIITDASGVPLQTRTAEAYNLMVEIVPEETEDAVGGLKLSAAVTGDYPPFTYDWYKIADVAAAAADRMDLDEHGGSFTAVESGSYVCVVTDSHGHQAEMTCYLEKE
ncbi:MAG: hypothetical protein IJS41_07945, partial [Clostridia bacterium]|nr:hypothetical protein [Clostridia bacterium]